MAFKKNFLWFGAVFILILAVITFVFIPTTSGASGSSTLVFGKWNKKNVEYVQDSFFIRQFQNLSEQMQNQGQQVNQFTYYQIMQSAFTSAIIRFAILEELEKAGYLMPTQLVDRTLVNYYLDSNGQYSASLYQQTPELTRSTRRKQIQEELTAQRFLTDTFGNSSQMYGYKVSTKELDFLKTSASPERSFSYVAFSTDTYPDAQSLAWAKNNASLFIKYNLSAIVVDTEAVAKKVSQSIANNEITFEDAVTTYSNQSGTDTTGKITRSFAYEVQTLFSNKNDLESVTSLTSGQLSPIVKTTNSFAIVRCDGDAVQPNFDDETILSSIKSYMKTNEKGIIQDYFVSYAKDFTNKARADGFAPAASANKLDVKTTSAFCLNYGNNDILTPVPIESNIELSSVVNNENFFKVAFALKANEVSEPIIADPYVLVLQLLEEKTADQQNLEMLPYLYSYYANSWSQNALSNAILKSPKFKDNFMETYLKYFLN